MGAPVVRAGAESSVLVKLKTACNNAFWSPYFWACFLYLVYNFMMLGIDYCSVTYPVDADGNPDPRCWFNIMEESTDPNTGDKVWVDTGKAGPLNNLYVATAVIHCINAMQYAYGWREFGVPLSSPLVLPDYVNTILAVLYIATSTQYPKMQAALTHETMPAHNAELAAAVLEVIASFGWLWSWWSTYNRYPGRGLTLDDPDFWAVGLLIPASIIYLIYNAQISIDPSTYGSNLLYVQGDVLYAVSSIGYMLASLRDCGFFWWLPTAGQYGYTYALAKKDEDGKGGARGAQAKGCWGNLVHGLSIACGQSGSPAMGEEDLDKVTFPHPGHMAGRAAVLHGRATTV